MSMFVGVMQNISEGKNVADVHQSFSMTDVGMGETARSLFVSFIGICAIGGSLISKKMYATLGGQTFTSFTTALMGIGFVWFSTVPPMLKQSWPMFAGAVMHCLTVSQGMYSKTVAAEMATAANWGQGEYQGALANMRALASAVLPLVLARIYAWSKTGGRNRPGLTYQVVAVTAILNELMFRSLSAEDLNVKK